jgi:hypothetical protein
MLWQAKRITINADEEHGNADGKMLTDGEQLIPG